RNGLDDRADLLPRTPIASLGAALLGLGGLSLLPLLLAALARRLRHPDDAHVVPPAAGGQCPEEAAVGGERAAGRQVAELRQLPLRMKLAARRLDPVRGADHSERILDSGVRDSPDTRQGDQNPYRADPHS